MEEVWKDAVGVEGYQVSNLGNVRSKDRYITTKNGVKKLRSGMILKTSTTHDGYKVFTNHIEGKRVTHRVHNVVYETFVSMIPVDKEIDHIDIDPSNNCVSNLRLVDRRENSTNRRNTKKYVGVVFVGKSYSVSIYYKGKSYNLGTEATEPEAHEVYDKASAAISEGRFEAFYETRRFRKIKGLPKHIFYRKRSGTYSANVKGVHIAESKDLEIVKDKLSQYLREHGNN